MKKSIILLCSLVLAAIFLFMGCDIPVDENQSEEQETAPDVEASAANVDKLYIGITLEETISIMGVRDRSVSSQLHPFRLEWDLDDGSVLCMTFAIENDDELFSGTSSETESQEIPELSAEQVEELREKMLSAKCISGYVKKGTDIIQIE